MVPLSQRLPALCRGPLAHRIPAPRVACLAPAFSHPRPQPRPQRCAQPHHQSRRPFSATTPLAAAGKKARTAAREMKVARLKAAVKRTTRKTGGEAGKKGKKGKRGRGGDHASDHALRVRVLRKNLHSPAPPPLRMARNRWLRHWTIHRAWMLYQRKQRAARQGELLRLYQSMQRACEELRRTAGPGPKEVGYLFRVATEMRGIYGHDGIPIEYARLQTETPGPVPWNHDWTR